MRPWPVEMGAWTWGGTSLIWAGGQPLNLEVLYGRAPIERDNLEMPGVQGRLIRGAWKEEAEYEIKFHLDGRVLSNGTPAADKMAAFHSNYTYLAGVIGSPSTWVGDGVTSVLTPYGGSPISAEVQGFVSPWETTAGSATGSMLPVTVTVIVPAGEHA